MRGASVIRTKKTQVKANFTPRGKLVRTEIGHQQACFSGRSQDVRCFEKREVFKRGELHSRYAGSHNQHPAAVPACRRCSIADNRRCLVQDSEIPLSLLMGKNSRIVYINPKFSLIFAVFVFQWLLGAERSTHTLS